MGQCLCSRFIKDGPLAIIKDNVAIASKFGQSNDRLPRRHLYATGIRRLSHAAVHDLHAHVEQHIAPVSLPSAVL